MANITAYYLERFASSETNLRRVMTRRIRRELKTEDGIDDARLSDARVWLDEIIADLKRQKLIDDRTYAMGRAARDRRLGKAPARTRAKLIAKGVARDLAAEATADDGSAEWAAAIALASRRRLGPYREKPRDADTDRRDLAAFARGGISYAVAKRLMALDEPPA
ncbi:MAG: RecX family transcriptional regulator [Rhodobacteraceae bacterium]|nr:RecX family transcriptional regulator [Paracoccaceae bacterium]